MTLVEYFVLAFASALWPTLVAVVIIGLNQENPKRLLLAFVVGGLMTTITVGLVLVFALGSSIDATRSTTDPAVDLTVGVLCLGIAFVAQRREHHQPLTPPKPKKPAHEGPSRTERALARGTLFAFLLGIGLDIAPSFFYLVALKDIGEANYSNAEVVVLVVGFCLMMFMLIELPLLSYVFAPEKTAVWANQFSSWLHDNARHLITLLAFAVGILLIVRGIISLL